MVRRKPTAWLNMGPAKRILPALPAPGTPDPDNEPLVPPSKRRVRGKQAGSARARGSVLFQDASEADSAKSRCVYVCVLDACHLPSPRAFRSSGRASRRL